MSALVRIVALAAVAAFATPHAAAAQGEQSRITGKVTDGSGGALPGVTVTIASPRLAKPITVFTDGVGQYSSPPLQSATYNVKFELSGFETRTNPAIYLQPGDVFVLDRQMALASVAETVEVVAPAPPPPPRVKIDLPKRPQPQPVPKALLASVCGPGQAGPSLAIGHVLGHRDEPMRKLLGNGDALAINVGTTIGVAVGQNYVVRRRFRTGDRNASAKQASFGQQTAGLVQVVEAGPTASTAVIVYLCGEVFAGDSIEAFDAMPQLASQIAGTPHFDEPAKIVFGEHGQSLGSPGQLMVIDKGLTWGARRGQHVTVFRRPLGGNGAVTAIGTAIVVVVNADSATIRIEKVTDAVTVGDLVALHR
jgi:hypothetical protein